MPDITPKAAHIWDAVKDQLFEGLSPHIGAGSDAALAFQGIQHCRLDSIIAASRAIEMARSLALAPLVERAKSPETDLTFYTRKIDEVNNKWRLLRKDFVDILVKQCNCVEKP